MKLKLKAYKSILLLFFITTSTIVAQYKVSGKVTSKKGTPLNKVEIYDAVGGLLATSNYKGMYRFFTDKKKITLNVFAEDYKLEYFNLDISEVNTVFDFELEILSEELSEILISAQRRKVFQLDRLKDVEETAIYAGKKSEVVLMNETILSTATNNSRQIYAQVAGLNIFENDDAGLQLNIGGRGLDPNRTSNFNTRQNGYDISADVLGYPESYYSPPAEAVEKIQIVRGAASLQYGTQFGGLVNFALIKPNPNKVLDIQNRSTIGSNGLYTNFLRVSGTKDKFSYLSYYNFKRGDGFRANSQFESKNAFFHVGYEFTDKTKLEAELTVMKYLAKQSGGLTDSMFAINPFQSNRERNWFKVDWLLYNIKLSHEFSKLTNFTFSFFGLNASRNAIGYRTNRVDANDPGGVRDLISSDFKKFVFEARLLSEYHIYGKEAVFLIGSKFYKAKNISIQGPGSDGDDADFSLRNDLFPYYNNQSNYENPNLNIAVFGENIFYINDEFSITPGVRFEYIETGSDGYVENFNFDAAGNIIFEERDFSSINKIRNFILAGIGFGYKPINGAEIYTNISQNYRSITFSDLNIVNPAYQIDENLGDETGFTIDLGVRGNFNRYLSYDVGVFGLFYNDRIGFVTEANTQLFNTYQLRTNVGDARILGLESILDFNLKKFFEMNSSYSLNLFFNTSLINSEYTASRIAGVVGNKVEFVPDVNIKTGVKFRYEDFGAYLQYTMLSKQYTDATNAEASGSGIVGAVPQYDVLDFSTSYKYKFLKLEAGVNNVLDNAYFTRRATGYPGPGIIPSGPRTFYSSLEINF